MIEKRIKNVFYILSLPFFTIANATSRFLGVASKAFKVVCQHTYEACDIFVKKAISCFSEQMVVLSCRQGRKPNIGRKIVYCIVALSFLSFFTYLFSQYFFTVNAGDRAVVTRFGKYERTITPGLGFYLPMMERYYIVEAELIREETFGFRQSRNINKNNIRDNSSQEKFTVNKYENDLLKEEETSKGFLSEKGNIKKELQKKPRLTHDYLREQNAPPRDESVKALREKIVLDEVLRQQNNFSNEDNTGQIAVKSEMDMLTGDLSIVEMKWTVQYTINNPKDYLFNSRDAKKNLRDIALTKMNEVVGKNTLNAVITTGRQSIEDEVHELIQNEVDHYRLGFNIKQVIILRSLPANETIFSFNEVNKASQDMEKYIFYAEREYMKIVPTLEGQAKKIVFEAEAYATKTINKAKGDASNFEQVRVEYEKAKKITRDRLYIEALESLYKQTPNIIVGDDLTYPLIFIRLQLCLRDFYVPAKRH